MKKLRENKIFKAISLILKILCVMVIIAFVAIVYLQRFSDNKISFFKFRMFTVVSDSMAPKYTIGDVLFAREKDPSLIKVGDDISYRGIRGDVQDKIITHQVVRIENDDGKYIFHAKGLGNIIEDPIIQEEQLYGVIVHKSFILSLFYKIVSTNVGFGLLIIVSLAFIGYEFVITLTEKEGKRREKNS